MHTTRLQSGDTQLVLHIAHPPDLIGQFLCSPVGLAGRDGASQLGDPVLDAHLDAGSIQPGVVGQDPLNRGFDLVVGRLCWSFSAEGSLRFAGPPGHAPARTCASSRPRTIIGCDVTAIVCPFLFSAGGGSLGKPRGSSTSGIPPRERLCQNTPVGGIYSVMNIYPQGYHCQQAKWEMGGNMPWKPLICRGDGRCMSACSRRASPSHLLRSASCLG